ncbi:MAG: two-component sensor histidine kinase [Pseudonocardiales bacterium]|nr:MAG: two-component sensor histidine kinase [Pseudonocardiales bacterium]
MATSVLAAGLVAGAVLIVFTLTHSLTSTLDGGARGTARAVAALVNNGQSLPEPLPVGDGNTVVVQVIDSRSRVRAASAGADHLVPLLSPSELAQVRAGHVVALPGSRAGITDPLRVVGLPAGPADDRQTVVVAVGAAAIGEGAHALRTALLIGASLLLVLLAALTWYVVGRTLRSVETLRRGAEEITGADESRQLPVPSGDDEVQRLAVTLNDMLARLDAASAQQRAFVADAAHELRSPLASLRTQLEVAARLGDRADWPHTADGALLDVARLSRLVDDLLLLARLDDRGPSDRLLLRPVDLRGIARDVVRHYDDARVPVSLTPGSRPATVEADADAVTRVLANLADNAVRHAATRVRLGINGGPSASTITVVDDGPGIPAEARERVFDRFTRLDDARGRDAGGAGLGLPIVRELVRAHGGTIELSDAEPGLRAVVSLPATQC